MDGWKIDTYKGKKIWTRVDQPKQNPQPQQQKQIDISTITAETIRQRAMEQHDNEQRLQNTAIVNYAHQSSPTKEEIEEAEDARRKAYEERMERLRHVMR
jgi:hypothetical protein